MKAILPLTAALLLVGGCALPVPVQVAVWALDGISLASSQKTLADHGVSALSQQDCSFWRGVAEGGDVCRDSATVLVDADEAVSGAPAAPAEAVEPALGAGAASTLAASAPVSAEELAAFETAAGPPAAKISAPPRPEPAVANGTDATFILASPRRLEPPASSAQSSGDGGVYYVIGSFDDRAQAHAALRRFQEFSAEVVAAQVDGRLLYRVTVGPLRDDAIRPMRGRLHGAGATNAWLWRASAGGPAEFRPLSGFAHPGR